jgi:hypothetical protein
MDIGIQSGHERYVVQICDKRTIVATNSATNPINSGEHAMKHSQNQDGQASAGNLGVMTDAELSNDVLDTITGGKSNSAIPMQDNGSAVSTNIEPKPVNELVGKIVNKNFA